jgi:hypothetical protein
MERELRTSGEATLWLIPENSDWIRLQEESGSTERLASIAFLGNGKALKVDQFNRASIDINISEPTVLKVVCIPLPPKVSVPLNRQPGQSIFSFDAKKLRYEMYVCSKGKEPKSQPGKDGLAGALNVTTGFCGNENAEGL